MGGMLSQNLLDLVDTAMVGAVGPVALAAVGIGAFANFMCAAVVLGLAAGVQTLVARRRGEHKLEEAAVPLTTGIAAAIAVGIPVSLILISLTDTLFPYLNDDSGVIAQGQAYLDIRLVGLVAIGMNHCFRGYLNGVELAKLYLRVIIVMHLLNIVLNYVFIFGKLGLPAMGSYGAGLGTTISLFAGSALYFYVVTPRAMPQGFLKRLPDVETVRSMLALAIPNSMQTLFFAGGFLALFWIIGKISVDAVAVSNVIVNLLKVAILPGVAFGLAAMTLVSEAIGRRELADAQAWGWNVVSVSVVVLTVIALPALIFPDLILRGFLHDPALVELGRLPLQITAASVLVDAIGMVLMNALIGAGSARPAMSVSIISQWVIGLPLCYLVGVTAGFGLLGVWVAQAVYRVIQTIVLTTMWRNGGWQANKL